MEFSAVPASRVVLCVPIAVGLGALGLGASVALLPARLAYTVEERRVFVSPADRAAFRAACVAAGAVADG